MADEATMGGATTNPVQVQKFLKNVDYPATKDDLIATAEEEGADENVLSALSSMDMDEFNSPNDVAEAIGKIQA